MLQAEVMLSQDGIEPSMSETRLFRILSLDGGGIRGLFTAALLSHIEQYTKKSIVECFDLIVGTSTGGIIGLAVARGIAAKEVLTFYQEEGQRIFGRPRIWPARLFIPKYDAQPLYDALQKLFSGALVREAKTRLCITSYEAVAGTPRVIKTDHAEGLHWGGDQLMWKVAAATSAAPTYFPAFRIDEQDCYLDGGVWANNPVLVGITEAHSRLKQHLNDLAVLSVGTGSKRFVMSYERASR